MKVFGGGLLAFCVVAIFSNAPPVSGEPEEECYAQEKDPYSLLGTKTSYFEAIRALPNDEPISFPGCSAKSVWVLVRHGSRNPSDDEIAAANVDGPRLRQAVAKNHADNRGTLCEPDLALIAGWRPTLTEDQEKLLVESGRRELREIGERFRKRIPEIFQQEDAGENSFLVRHTDKERTKSSAEGFVVGAFNHQGVKGARSDERVKFLDPVPGDDPLLRFYKYCDRWDDHDDDPATFSEQAKFEEGEEMHLMMDRVRRRLGFRVSSADSVGKGKYDPRDVLAFEDVLNMYDMCRFERAKDPTEPAPWCAAFSEEDLKVMEYYWDLDGWVSKGYGYELNTKVACPLVKDMVDTFSQNKTMRPLGTFHFSHSTTILTLQTLLGLHRDELEPKHDNFEQEKDRMYRSSLIGAFASNVGFVLFDCEEEPAERIAVLHQEIPVELPACDGRVLCGWNKFNSIFQDVIECPFEEMCARESSGRRSTSLHFATIFSLAFVSYKFGF